MVDDLYRVQDDGSILLSVHAQPGAGRSAVVGRHGDALKIRVAAPPQGGRANEALTALLAEEFGLKAGGVELIGGGASRTKRFKLTGIEAEDFVRALERLVGRAGSGQGQPGNVTGRPDVRDGRR
jgi:uncharacterized protein (TIGR00251 family)